MPFLRPFVESIRQDLGKKVAVFRQVIESIRLEFGNKLAVCRQFVESTGQDLGNQARPGARQLLGSIRQGLDDKVVGFNHRQLLQAIGGGLGYILTSLLLNLISSSIWGVEQNTLLGTVSGFIILVRDLPMYFVHYYPLTITAATVWLIRHQLFIKLEVKGRNLPIVAGSLDRQITGPGSHPLVAQRQDSLILVPLQSQTIRQPPPQVPGPTDPQAAAPSDPHGTGPLDLELLFYLLKQHCGVPAPAMSGNSAIESISWARAGPEAMALTIRVNGVVADVEEVYHPLVTLPSGSKVLYRRFEFGPQTQNYESEDLRKLVLESMSRARILDPECTLQLGSFAVLKYTDSGLKWWRLQKSWTPTITNVRQSPWNLFYTISGFSRKWIVRGSNLGTATLKASTMDKIEEIKVLHHYKLDSREDELLCDEPRLIQASAIGEQVYICASNSVKVQDGVVCNVQSEPRNVNKSSWKFGIWPSQVIDDEIPKTGYDRLPLTVTPTLEETTSISSAAETPLLDFKQHGQDLNLLDSLAQDKNPTDAQTSLGSSSRAAPSVEKDSESRGTRPPSADSGLHLSVNKMSGPVPKPLKMSCLCNRARSFRCRLHRGNQQSWGGNNLGPSWSTTSNSPTARRPFRSLSPPTTARFGGGDVHSPQTTSPQKFGDPPGNPASPTRTDCVRELPDRDWIFPGPTVQALASGGIAGIVK